MPIGSAAKYYFPAVSRSRPGNWSLRAKNSDSQKRQPGIFCYTCVFLSTFDLTMLTGIYGICTSVDETLSLVKSDC